MFVFVLRITMLMPFRGCTVIFSTKKNRAFYKTKEKYLIILSLFPCNTVKSMKQVEG